ncbi:MAG: copper-binding protein [Thiobacillus sp.]|nr:copper-binding protein [Thiobacillus sp.]
MKSILSTVVFGLALAAGTPAWAAEEHDHSHGAASPSVAPAALADAEVKKVNKDQGKITLKHGPIENLGMPGMTMVFQVQNAGALDQVKAGDKVRFHAEKINGALTVTELELTK